ncbi:MAG: hypothetical protein AB4042_11780, partial [Leptolyngbyaceae cyanobacterium]
MATWQHRHWGLWGLAALLVAIHMTLVLRIQAMEQVSLSVLIWIAVAYQLTERTQPLLAKRVGVTALNGKRGSSPWIGTLVVVVMLFKVPQISGSGLFLHLFPLVGALG